MTTEPAEPQAEERTALYRLYSATDELLYVGITNDPQRRWQHHAAVKTWWPEVARQTVEWHEDRAKAESAEIMAIRSEAPRYNGQHAPSPIQVEATIRKHRIDAPYLQIAAALRTAIREGDYPPGTKLPPLKDLKVKFGTSTATATKAIEELKREGLIEGRTGAGVFVLAPTGRTVPVPLHDIELAAETLRRALTSVELLTLARLLVEP